MTFKEVFEAYSDFLAPKLDTYEAAIYLYIYRHSRLIEKAEVEIGFKSARFKISFGAGVTNTPMSEGSCYKKLRSLQEKGCIQILDSTRKGTKIRLLLPSEIPNLIPQNIGNSQAIDIEEIDFFTTQENRLTILDREKHLCFYCGRKIDKSNYVIEHIISRPAGGNGYRNLVAACKNCNDKKGDISAEDFLRSLYRDGLLSDQELTNKLQLLTEIKNGKLKPAIN